MGSHRDELVAAQYFVAVAGTAALRHCLTRPSSVRARLDDIAGIVGALDRFPNDLRLGVVEHDFDDGYTAWAPRYDGPNPATALDDEVVGAILEALPVGDALDAACGTGRHATRLAGLGHRVVGVDGNAAMLEVARAKVPDADLRQGRLDDLPVDDASVDLVVCSLALTHVPELAPVLAEFARVVRPGGAVVLSDMHPTTVLYGGTALFPHDDSHLELHYVANLLHPVSEYVTAATAAGLRIVACAEPEVPEAAIVTNPAYALHPEAVRQAYEGTPFQLVWQLERPSP